MAPTQIEGFNDARLGLTTSLTVVKPTDWMIVVPYVVVALGLGLGSGLLQPETPSLFEVLILPFLLIVTALGYTCGYLYVRSGSLRAPILVHWATVVSWNLFLGRELAV